MAPLEFPKSSAPTVRMLARGGVGFFIEVLHLDDNLTQFSQPLLPCSEMVIQRLGFVVSVPVFEIPLHYSSVKGTRIQNEVVDIRLLVFPELRLWW